jgi:nitrilase
LKLALWQTEGVFGNPSGSIDRLAHAAAQAADAGADLLLCPELYLCGYNAPEAIRKVAEPADGPSSGRIAALCAARKIAIAYGYAERETVSGLLYNAAQLIDATGAVVLQYRKTHLWGSMERGLFTAGATLGAPAAFGAWQVGMLICYDIEFPEAARALALQGADLLLVPTALPAGADIVPNLLVPARAAENTLFVAYCNRCGTESGLDYAGASRIASPDGTLCADAGSGESMTIADITITARRRALAASPYLNDRRERLYTTS